MDLLAEIYNSFNPFETASKEAYVDCREVRGNWEVYQELGKKVVLSNHPTCQLCSGHRGTGKSTELLRLKENLEARGYFVVYFAVDDQDIEPEDVEYADILMACTRHLVEAVKIEQHNPLLEWMESRWESFKDLMLMEVSFEKLNLEQLLRNRSLLEYRYYDENDSLQIWCDVHPLIEGTPKFKDALSKIQSVTGTTL